LSVREKEYRVDYLARVEGEGALYVKVRDGEVVDVRLRPSSLRDYSRRCSWAGCIMMFPT
jgi:translation initiation factor IF-1